MASLRLETILHLSLLASLSKLLMLTNSKLGDHANLGLVQRRFVFGEKNGPKSTYFEAKKRELKSPYI